MPCHTRRKLFLLECRDRRSLFPLGPLRRREGSIDPGNLYLPVSDGLVDGDSERHDNVLSHVFPSLSAVTDSSGLLLSCTAW